MANEKSIGQFLVLIVLLNAMALNSPVIKDFKFLLLIFESDFVFNFDVLI